MFDQDRLRINRIRSRCNLQKSSFYRFVREDILYRLSLLDFKFRNILLIHTNAYFFVNHISNAVGVSCEDITIIEDLVDFIFPDRSFDCVISPLGVYWVDDIPLFLNKINNILTDNGIFIGNFPGGQSFRNLRYELIRLETKFSNGHFPHILPLIKFDDIVRLLSQASFNEYVIDLEKIKMDFKNPILLMKELKKIGESNILKSISYSINKSMYNELRYKQEKSFTDYIEFISFIASKQKNTIKCQKF